MDFTKFTCLTASGESCQYGTGITEIARAAAAREGKKLVIEAVKEERFGADGQRLYITTSRDTISREALDAAPLSGRLFSVDVATPGVTMPTLATDALAA